jgi:hypothetical protein
MRKETTRVSKETHTIIKTLDGKWFDAFRENREFKPKGCQQISVKQMQDIMDMALILAIRGSC